jgi:hypothetical protein
VFQDALAAFAAQLQNNNTGKDENSITPIIQAICPM